MTSQALRKSNPVRQHKRYSYPADLVVTREGAPGHISLNGPDLSVHGMFINTPAVLSEGTVLKLSFRLIRVNKKINLRGEVRYRIPGIGVGVEFVELSDETRNAIEQELEQEIAQDQEQEQQKEL
jgi:hypothetical protein